VPLEVGDKPGFVVDGHFSGMPIAGHLKQPTREIYCGAISLTWPCSGWGLPCSASYPADGELLPRHCTLTPHFLLFSPPLCFANRSRGGWSKKAVGAVSFLWHFPSLRREP